MAKADVELKVDQVKPLECKAESTSQYNKSMDDGGTLPAARARRGPRELLCYRALSPPPPSTRAYLLCSFQWTDKDSHIGLLLIQVILCGVYYTASPVFP